MSSVMNPHGLEPRNTYWIRRVLVALAALLALMLLWWVVSSLFGGRKDDGQTVTANPQNPQSLTVSDSPTPTPGASMTPSATATPGASTTPAASAPASATASAAPSATPVAGASASSTPSVSTAPAGPTTCDPTAIVLTLTGDKAPRIGTATRLTVSFTNTGSQSCYLNLAKQPVTVAVTSGSDRIWSSAHCSRWQPRGILELAPNKPQSWSTTWSTQRSADGCTLKSSPLGAGTYVARATMEGGDAARLVMNLHH